MKRTIIIFSVITLLVGVCNAQNKQVKNKLNLTSSTKQEVAKTTKMLTQQPFKLLFSTAQDITNTWGQIHFGVTPALKNDELRDRRVLAFRTSSDGRNWTRSGVHLKVKKLCNIVTENSVFLFTESSVLLFTDYT